MKQSIQIWKSKSVCQVWGTERVNEDLEDIDFDQEEMFGDEQDNTDTMEKPEQFKEDSAETESRTATEKEYGQEWTP